MYILIFLSRHPRLSHSLSLTHTHTHTHTDAPTTFCFPSLLRTMNKRSSPIADRKEGYPSMFHRRGDVPCNCRSLRPAHRESKPQVSPKYYRDRPPGPPRPRNSFNRYLRPNFVIELCSGRRGTDKADVASLVDKCKCKPDNFTVSEGGFAGGKLFYEQWTETLETIVRLWEIRFDGGHSFTPRLIQNVIVPSDMDELRDRLKTLFVKRVKGFMEGASVQNWEKKLGVVVDEIAKLTASLRKRNSIAVYNELLKRQKGLLAERDLIRKRIKEFKSGMKCTLEHLEGKTLEEDSGGEGMEVFSLGGDFNWGRIHSLVMRECRRLDDGLPIYAFRQELLCQIHNQQIMVLIGETGSGKSTQLVQFLADSGVAGTNSIICTQPRKLAAISLSQRVNEESSGCYPDTSITCYASYSSARQLGSNVIYMTDHCLLQHYMNDKSLSGISCIIIDEAHERSLNTDLLLALLKKLLDWRPDLRLIIMSATADANQLAEYFFGCGTFNVAGRNYPVDIKYVPPVSNSASASGVVAPYVSDVLKMVTEIHRTEREGTILAFLTSQMEVEWACEKFQSPSAIALALHGKLSYEDQIRVFLNYPGRRKVIFSTNIAETSLTIPGVKYVVDSGMVKESRFDPCTGMNVLRVCRISQSSANQRAGRAGRTEPGRCYRLFSENDFELMPSHLEPEIRRVHLGVAVLRMLALGVEDIQSFDFVDAPSPKAIEMAIRSLIQLGAVKSENDVFELTKDGQCLVRLGIEPRLGKIIISCHERRLSREGVVLAAVMANASSIFCRVGNDENKLKSDCLKVQFCHRMGDLFTLLSVYKEWEGVPQEKKNKWCWENSINAKSMRRCHDTVKELEDCLQNELSMIIPSYWRWNLQVNNDHDRTLKNVILSALSENIAVYSGYDQLGYLVAASGKYVQLHPSCSLLIFGQRPSWVVFGEILSVHNQYLVCVTTFDFESLSTLCPPPPFDIFKIDSQKLQSRVLNGFGSALLKRFCGKFNSSLNNLISRVRTLCMDERIGIEINVGKNEIMLFSSSKDMEKVSLIVTDALEYEMKLLQNECLEKFLYQGGNSALASMALFGAGAEIKHLELEKRCLTVEVFRSDVNAVRDKELLAFLESNTSGVICAVHKYTSIDESEKWGKVTFLTPDAAKKAVELNQVEFDGSLLKIIPTRSTFGLDHKMFAFPAVRAKIYWPRRCSKGFGIVKCEKSDVECMVDDFSDLLIGGKTVRCQPSMKRGEGVVISGLDKEISEDEIVEVLRMATGRKILDFFLVRGDAVENPPSGACEEAILRQIASFMPRSKALGNCIRVQVFPSEPKDFYTKALIMFDGSLHLEAAKALEQLDGNVLPGCLSWQKIKCQQLFQSSVSCPAAVYFVIKEQLDSTLKSLRHVKGVECTLERNENGSYRVKLSANATKIVAELRRPLEQLMKGKIIDHAGLTPTVLQVLFSRDGISLMKSIQRETGTFLLFDKHNLNVKVFGSPDKVELAEQRLVQSLLALEESKQLEINLRGGGLPPDLMKEVVAKFGPDLHGLKEKVPGAGFTLNTKRQIISVHGSKDLKQDAEGIIYELAQSIGPPLERIENDSSCSICLCEVEDEYRLEGCGHVFCRSCLVEQCDSAIKSQDSFPMRCTHLGCRSLILLADLRLLLSGDKLDELFRASVGAFVAGSGGTYRFCPSPDCPSVYRVADPGTPGAPFMCGACSVETCTRCHVEYHPYLSCEKYKEYKEDPDSGLKEWCKGKEEYVKKCPVCGFTIEKVEGCNHVECRCGRHICWACLEYFSHSNDCYDHLRAVHLAII